MKGLLLSILCIGLLSHVSATVVTCTHMRDTMIVITNTTVDMDAKIVAVVVVIDPGMTQSSFVHFATVVASRVVADPQALIIIVGVHSSMSIPMIADAIQATIVIESTATIVPIVAIVTRTWDASERVVSASLYHMISKRFRDATDDDQSNDVLQTSSCSMMQFPTLYTDYVSAKRIAAWELHTFIATHWTESQPSADHSIYFNAATALRQIKITSQVLNDVAGAIIGTIVVPLDCPSVVVDDDDDNGNNIHHSVLYNSLQLLDTNAKLLVSRRLFSDTISAAVWLVCATKSSTSIVIKQTTIGTVYDVLLKLGKSLLDIVESIAMNIQGISSLWFAVILILVTVAIIVMAITNCVAVISLQHQPSVTQTNSESMPILSQPELGNVLVRRTNNGIGGF